MNRTLVALLVSLVAFPAFAGCLGGDDAPQTDETEECGERCDIDKDVSEGLGKVTGEIIDDTFNPVAGANVTLRELDLTTKTNAAGKYAFNDLEPGTYTIFAQKVPTHTAVAEQVQVVAGEPVELNVMLPLLPPPAVPYLFEDDKVGLIGCTVAFGLVRPDDQCRHAPGTNANNEFNFPLDKRPSSMIVMIESGGGTIGDTELVVTVLAPPGLTPNTIDGPSPLVHRWDVTEETAFPSWEFEGNFTLRVRPSYNASMPQVSYQQEITVYVGFFYNGMAVPEGYSPKGDG